MNAGRDTKGRFAPGNGGGPGRPRRAIERDYLAKMSENISLDDWGEIIRKAVADAKLGDARARDFVARYALGETPGTLRELAAREAVGLTVRHDLIPDAHSYRIDHFALMAARLDSTPEIFDKIHPFQLGELPSGSPSSQNGKYQHPVPDESSVKSAAEEDAGEQQVEMEKSPAENECARRNGKEKTGIGTI